MGAAKVKRPALDFSVVESDFVETADTGIANVVIIGRDDSDPFRDLLHAVRQDQRMRIVAQFQTLKAGLQAGIGLGVPADFVMVLQSQSDEFSQDHINELIGRLLFARIMVCYGPWCIADGRSHELWPVAFRMPAASAMAMLDLELTGFREKTQPLFAMSAGEEVFAHRSVFSDVSDKAVRRRGIVISDDAQLRRTVTGILNVLNCDSTSLPMEIASIQSYLSSQNRDFDFVIIDLDGPASEVCDCLARLNAEVRIKSLAGMSVFAASLDRESVFPAESGRIFAVTSLVEKTELLHQMSRLLKTSDSAAAP